MAKRAIVLACEMCPKRSAQLTLIDFGMGEGYDVCPTCLAVKQAFDALTEKLLSAT